MSINVSTDKENVIYVQALYWVKDKMSKLYRYILKNNEEKIAICRFMHVYTYICMVYDSSYLNNSLYAKQ